MPDLQHVPHLKSLEALTVFRQFAALLFAKFGILRPAPWQKGFWIDHVRPGLIHIGVGFAIIAIEEYIAESG